MKRTPKAIPSAQRRDDHLPLLLTIPQTGVQLNLEKDAVYERIRDGRLKAIDIAGPGSTRTHLRVPLEALHEYIRDCPTVLDP